MSDQQSARNKPIRLSLCQLLALLVMSLLSQACRATEGEYSVSASLDDDSDALQLVVERRVLERTTPRNLDVVSLATRVGYKEFPSRVFAPKNASIAQAHDFLMKVSQQVYQQALMARLTGDMQYASNAARILRELMRVDLNFMSDPKKPGYTNDNRYLEAAWFVTHLARGARILDYSGTPAWKAKEDWPSLLSDFNLWIDRGRALGPREQPMLQLISHQGTMNWVHPRDQRGSTNRTFALLEAQIRLAELRRGYLTPMRSIRAVYKDFRIYLARYWTPERDCLGDPNVSGSDELLCLPNKDEGRRDTYHPLMGLASIVHILDVGHRFGLSLTESEINQVIKGLRWGADNNTARPGGFTPQQISKSIPVWEMARKVLPVDQFGPLENRQWLIGRAEQHVRVDLAWGFTLLSNGF